MEEGRLDYNIVNIIKMLCWYLLKAEFLKTFLVIKYSLRSVTFAMEKIAKKDS